MHYDIQHINLQHSESDCLIVGVFADKQLTTIAKQLDILCGGYISKILRRGNLRRECGQTLLLTDVPNLRTEHVLLVNCGKLSSFNESVYRKVIFDTVNALKNTAVKKASCYLTNLTVNGRNIYWNIRQAIELSHDALYSFTAFKTQEKSNSISLNELIFGFSDLSELKLAKQALQDGLAISTGIKLAKDLGNMPPNICTPSYLAQQARKLARDHKEINTTIIGEKDIKKLGMGAFMAVTQGSHESAKLIVINYRGAIKNKRPIVLIGKGVTFDSGGLSLKPSSEMELMKFDMCGAASVLGTITAVAQLHLPVNIVCILAATENMPDGKSCRPGDVVKTMSGQTVEIVNTDAEGRLILCDVLTYVEKFNPAVVIDVATLTGAVMAALGTVASGLMYNDETLATALQKAAEQSWDRVWLLPLWDDYQYLINSNVADMANFGRTTEAKTIAAACFLSRFSKKFSWAHLDIAGTALKNDGKHAASGRPVSLLAQYVLNYCH